MQVLLFIIGVLFFIGLVLVHEWGHFVLARRNGVKVEEFGLGFPPRAWGRKLKSGMILSLNWLPLGGFVKLKGEFDTDTRKGAFGAASLWAKTRILLAGVTMNLLVGLALLMVLAWVGLPVLINQQAAGQDQFTVKSDTKVIKSQVFAGYVEPNSPASKIGLTNRDIITEIKGAGQDFKISNTSQLHDATQALRGQNVSVSFQKANKQTGTTQVKLRSLVDVTNGLKKDASIPVSAQVTQLTGQISKDEQKTFQINSAQDFYDASQKTYGKISLTYRQDGVERHTQANLNPKGYFGLSPLPLEVRRSTWSAPIVALGFTKQLVILTFQGLGHALSGLGSAIAGLVTANHEARQNGQTQAESQVGGPVAIVAILWGYGSLGINFTIMIIAIISLTLALMNVLPIPALDGGRLFMILLSRGLFKKPLSRLAEERLTATGMALLLMLIALITLVDVNRFF
jgi:regulator of sigma E protease